MNDAQQLLHLLRNYRELRAKQRQARQLLIDKAAAILGVTRAEAMKSDPESYIDGYIYGCLGGKDAQH